MKPSVATKKTKKLSKVIHHERIINDAPRIFEEHELEIGDVSNQGDLILVRIKSLPEGAKKRSDRQLAIGNTQGSRHILERGNVWDCDPKSVSQHISDVCKGVNVGERYIGPVFQTLEGLASVTHPEHGDQNFHGNMTIACVYQRSLDSEEREQRVID